MAAIAARLLLTRRRAVLPGGDSCYGFPRTQAGFWLATLGYGSQGGRRGVTPASMRLRPKAMCDSGRVRGTTMCVSTPLCEKQ